MKKKDKFIKVSASHGSISPHVIKELHKVGWELVENNEYEVHERASIRTVSTLYFRGADYKKALEACIRLYPLLVHYYPTTVTDIADDGDCSIVLPTYNHKGDDLVTPTDSEARIVRNSKNPIAAAERLAAQYLAEREEYGISSRFLLALVGFIGMLVVSSFLNGW